jgi:hypothetical protein
MKYLVIAVGVAACLGGCVRKAEDAASEASAHGRYSGVGTYVAGRLWRKMVVADQAKEPSAAKLLDDDQIIVVLDSHTGEVRQCGNLTGYCITTNPWTKSPSASQAAPVKLTVHEDQLNNESVKVQMRGSVGLHAEKPTAPVNPG